MEGKRDEGLEAPGLILELPQLDQVVDPVFWRFDMAVKHGSIGPESQAVGSSHDFQPLLGAGFTATNFLSNPVIQNFSSSSRKRAQPCFLQSKKNILEGKAREVSKVFYLHRGKSLNVNMGKLLFQPPDCLHIVAERKVGMEAIYNVKLRDSQRERVSGFLNCFLNTHGIGIWIIPVSAEGTEFAAGDADVSHVEVSIDIEEDVVLSFSLLDPSSQIAQGQEVVGLHEGQPVFSGEPLAGEDLFTDVTNVVVYGYVQGSSSPVGK
jgi:hypothetical protein